VTIGQEGDALRQLRTLFTVGATGDLSDGQLLERFVTARGEVAELAFATLVERHGPMVLHVCCATLPESDDAHDAFQATFLVLLRRARSLWVRDSLGPWLHQVAYRTASCLRVSLARRRRLERDAVEASAKESRPFLSDELVRVLHEELGKLPERYRAPVVLCDLESTTHEQAARHLGWPVGTVKSRLTRAREILGDRLRRRGFAPDVGLLAAMPGLRGFESMIPHWLVDRTTRAAVQFVTARTILSGSVAALTREVLGIMSLHRSFKVASLLAVVIATASGVESLAQKQEGPEAGRRLKQLKSAVRVDDLPASVIEPGKFRITVAERGRLELSKVADVINEVEGITTILSILPEGAKVKTGDQVGTLDSSPLKAEYARQQITAQQAEASFQNAKLTREVAEVALDEFVKGVAKREQETLRGAIALAQLSVQKAVERVERTRQGGKRMEEALAARKGAVTPSDIIADLDLHDRLDDAGLVVMRETLSLEQAKARLDVFQTHTMDRTTRELTNDIEKSRMTELSMKAILELEKDKLDKLGKEIKKCVLVSPGNGTIVYGDGFDRKENLHRIEVGATVRDRQPIFKVVDFDGPMRVVAKINESRVERVTQGMHARISVNAFPGKTLTGVVEGVAPKPDPQRSFEHTSKVYTALIRIENRFPELRSGMTADVEIPIVELDGVLTVPILAVLHFDDKDHVAVKRPGGGFEWRDVILGEANDTSVVIKQGLRRGESIILAPLDLISEVERRENFPASTTPAEKPTAPTIPEAGRPRRN
jgi:HlyD family secretion protein